MYYPHVVRTISDTIAVYLVRFALSLTRPILLLLMQLFSKTFTDSSDVKQVEELERASSLLEFVQVCLRRN